MNKSTLTGLAAAAAVIAAFVAGTQIEFEDDDSPAEEIGEAVETLKDSVPSG